MEYFSALQRKEILSESTAGMNPEDTMLSEMSQSQKDSDNDFNYVSYLK